VSLNDEKNTTAILVMNNNSNRSHNHFKEGENCCLGPGDGKLPVHFFLSLLKRTFPVEIFYIIILRRL